MSADLVQQAVPEFEKSLELNGIDLSSVTAFLPKGATPGAAPTAIPAWLLTLAWPIVAKIIADVAIPFFKEKFPAAADALDAIAAWLRGGAKSLPI